MPQDWFVYYPSRRLIVFKNQREHPLSWITSITFNIAETLRYLDLKFPHCTCPNESTACKTKFLTNISLCSYQEDYNKESICLCEIRTRKYYFKAYSFNIVSTWCVQCFSNKVAHDLPRIYVFSSHMDAGFYLVLLYCGREAGFILSELF